MTIHPDGSRVVDRDTGNIGTVLSSDPMVGKYLVHMDHGPQSSVWWPDTITDSLDRHALILDKLIAEVDDPALTESWRNAWTRLGLLIGAAQLTFEVQP